MGQLREATETCLGGVGAREQPCWESGSSNPGASLQLLSPDTRVWTKVTNHILRPFSPLPQNCSPRAVSGQSIPKGCKEQRDQDVPLCGGQPALKAGLSLKPF